MGAGAESSSLDNPLWIKGPGIIRSCLGCDGCVRGFRREEKGPGLNALAAGPYLWTL